MQRLIAVTLLAAAATAGAQDFPKLKPGLWTTTSTLVRGPTIEPRTATLCLDDSVQQEMFKMSSGKMAGMCSKHEIKVTGNKVTTEAVCDNNGVKMQSHSVMTLSGNTSYRTEAKATFDPPLNGMKETNTVIEGKYLGACKPGQHPGDMTLPNGQTMNIRQMMKGKS